MRTVLWILLVLAVSGFGTVRSFGQSPVQMEADALMARWLWAISHEYVDGYANCYWPDATNEAYDKNGQSSLVSGQKALRQRQQAWADQMDFSKMDLAYPEPTRFVPAGDGLIVYAYVLKQFDEMEIFYFQRRNGELRILRQLDLFYTK